MEGCNLVCLPETFALMPRGRQDVLVFAENYGEGAYPSPHFLFGKESRTLDYCRLNCFVLRQKDHVTNTCFGL